MRRWPRWADAARAGSAAIGLLYSPGMPSPSLLASVVVPASSANLGSGFDCFAAALSLRLRAELPRGDEAGILLEAHGEAAPTPNAAPEQHLVTRPSRAGLRPAGGGGLAAACCRLDC